ncbi:MAG: Tat (twin-arginine translocation) pathway signal sequence containing protein [Hymenobacter sp.]|jgi:hypothetical protein|nr:Tat (twin-arginine translocation) pathway signal sequence containing protein [Hymenobacter sp.]
MSLISPPSDRDSSPAQPLYTPIKRRSFFMYAGATAGATALVLAGCSKDSDPVVTTSSTVSFGTGDASVLNYAYALEQLEAAFYAQVKASTVVGFSATETAYFAQVAAHEAIHRDFLRAAINRDFSGKLLQNLTPDFSTIDFTKRLKAAGDTKLGVLDAAKTFEDLGVAAYNGVGKMLRSTLYVTLAGKIVSIEARHAAFVRDLITPGSFASDDQVDPITGLDKSMTPLDVIAAAQPFITEKLDASTIGQ